MVRIITDSAADLHPEEYTRLNVACISLSVCFGSEEYRENISLSKDRFYELLTSSEHTPKTSQASPQVLLDLFEDAHKCGDEAIYISISSALSGTYQTAMMTRQLVDSEHCFVFDSLNATGGQRMIVEQAARLRDQGLTAAQIVAELEQLRSRIELYACIDTLEYLYRGGRISQVSYKLGTLANIKPIISVDREGKVAVPAKAMGMRKGMAQLCSRLETKCPDPDYPFYVMYTNNRAVGQALAEKIRALGIEVDEDHIIQVGAAIGSHIGPEACGYVYIA